MVTPTRADLLDAARAAARSAFAPYSHFPVGAAVVDASGRVFTGCNVESASFGLSMCAERVALFIALAAGAERPFRAAAVVCLEADPALGLTGRMPCGACRQVMSEHFADDAPIHVEGAGTYTVGSLLPHAFTLGARSTRAPR